MIQSLGQLGRLAVMVEDGTAVVTVNGRRWLLDPLCLKPAPGEQPENEESEIFLRGMW